MPRIFISYRREDSLTFAGRIYDKLSGHFGAGNVFIDVDAIPFGVDFRQHLGKAVAQCDVLLALIGEDWLDASEAGRRRLDDPGDFVRIEIESALERGITVIPLLLGQASMPREHEMPGRLKELAYRNAASIDAGRDFHNHMDRLIRELDAARQEAEAAERAAVAKRAAAERQEAELAERLQAERRAEQQARDQAQREAQEAARRRKWAEPAPKQWPAPAKASPNLGAREVLVVGHGTLLFWWPVWVISLINGLLSAFTPISSPNLGVLFIAVVLLVIGVTNVRIRGVWPVVIVVAIILVSLALAFFGLFDRIFQSLGFLSANINAAMYFVIAGALFLPWLVVVLLVDRQTCIRFSPGQIRVCLDSNEPELAFDTTGLLIQKFNDDLLLHWILGFGSGDIVVRTAGAVQRDYRLSNVLFIGQKMRMIEQILQSGN